MKKGMYTPEELAILIDAINKAPQYLSKRFIFITLLGWTDEMISENAKLKDEEETQKNIRR